MAVQNFGSAGGGYQLSPGVNVSEIDLTTTTSPASTTTGAFAGVFQWGPVGERVLVTSENDLVKTFGKPSSINPETWFTAANFLSYGNALFVSRAANTQLVFAAIANSQPFSANSTHTIKNRDDYDTKSTSFNSAVQYIAKCPGALGNSLKVSVCDNANQYNSNINLVVVNSTVNVATASITLSIGSNTGTVNITNGAGWTAGASAAQAALNNILSNLASGDFIVVGNTSVGTQALKVVSVGAAVDYDPGGIVQGANSTITFNQPLKLATAVTTNSISRYWEYYNQVEKAPGRSAYVEANGNTAAQVGNTAAQNDELHVVVVDEDGKFTGNPGLVLEVFSAVSRATDAKLADSTTNYYKNVINDQSQYIWVAQDRSTAVSANAKSIATTSATAPLTISFQGGTDKDETEDLSTGATLASIAQAYDVFASTEDTDISLVMTGKSRGGTNKEQLANYLIDNIAEVRQDCIVFASPDYSDVVNQTVNTTQNVIDFRNSVRSSSYGVLDSGYKYQYDKYNDVYRWVPLNGDIAGLCVRTDNTRDPWFSPAGTTRGQIRNTIKLAYNPNKAQRDQLYKNGINPVITQPGQGTFLFGDKTLLAKASAFDRINVRRLFIVLEKVISNAAKSFLFEFNDEFTRAQFRNLVEPYLRDVQGRRGIYDFKVVCDSTNNTPEIIDANSFVGDIYIKPAKSINYIQLNFVAVRSGVQFSEIVGG